MVQNAPDGPAFVGLITGAVLRVTASGDIWVSGTIRPIWYDLPHVEQRGHVSK
ncbi:MAG: hypothetical protein IH878_02055 [Gemmatimonadetes bacterium]|nr:hypothetical protein [Gemmatimonadota bacterium]